MNGQKTHDYDDILHLPHHVSARHPQMSRMNRAAQFSPFAALTGYGDAVRETARLTEERVELDESRKEELNRRLTRLDSLLSVRPASCPPVTITCFSPDSRKEGGSYITLTAPVKRIDTFAKALILEDGRRIPLEDLTELDGDFFETDS